MWWEDGYLRVDAQLARLLWKRRATRMTWAAVSPTTYCQVMSLEGGREHGALLVGSTDPRRWRPAGEGAGHPLRPDERLVSLEAMQAMAKGAVRVHVCQDTGEVVAEHTGGRLMRPCAWAHGLVCSELDVGQDKLVDARTVKRDDFSGGRKLQPLALETTAKVMGLCGVREVETAYRASRWIYTGRSVHGVWVQVFWMGLRS